MIRVAGFLLLLLAASAYAESLTGRVITVNDGDTLILRIADRQPVKVRLAGIDAPEYNQPYGKAARRALSAWVSGRTVQVTVYSRDDYGRVVGTLDVSSQNVEAALVKQGAAWVYRRYNRNPHLLELEAQAKAAHRGLWALPEDQRIPPWVWRRHDKKTGSLTTTSSASTPPSGCGAKRTCSEMSDCKEAQFYLKSCGVKRLDRDQDGTPCERLCKDQ
ncbi:MAG TPA: thermonuclease family protein [Candidatus Competibacteraceae bacterium]|nr:thermonuclease family protein [Candidatus Competibacteraceae bacterium]MCP5133330.1 thermonuclease family protein [Gammaproteobacteria bacterium]HPF57256.1 thermonuclease family protein [Candidatus Competibacteraceae bacterium]HRY17929.1 thermonuclease family protein [Candidatus Competibacteraceae bacterium]